MAGTERGQRACPVGPLFVVIRLGKKSQGYPLEKPDRHVSFAGVVRTFVRRLEFASASAMSALLLPGMLSNF